MRFGEKDFVFDKRPMAIIGDHEPIINTPL